MQVYQLKNRGNVLKEPAPPASVASGGGEHATGDFFIPDICAPRSVFIMVLLAELMVFVYTLASSTLPVFNWELLATSSLFVLWVVMLSAALLCWLRGFFARQSLALATLLSLLLVLSVTAVSSRVALALYPQLLRNVDPGWWILRNLLVAVMLAGIVLRNFYLQHQLRQQERLELEARLDSLRTRIRPHFLFNTLNAISTLILDGNNKLANTMVSRLSRFLRYTLDNDPMQKVTVAEEISALKLYLDIEHVRFDERLQLHFDIEEGAETALMPSLLLQPLVENAIKYAISQSISGGTIAVSARVFGGELLLAVADDGPGLSPGKGRSEDGGGVGLANCRERLRELYGKDQSFRLSQTEPHGLTINIRLPLEREESPE